MIIASAFAFDPQSMNRIPCHRIKPIDGACKRRNPKPSGIAPTQMNHFMQQNGVQPIGGPLVNVRRQKQSRFPKRPDHWHGSI